MTSIIDYIPPEYRKILHTGLADVKAINEDHFPEGLPDGFLEVPTNYYKRLDSSSIIISSSNHRKRIGFRNLAEKFAVEQRMIPWWMWTLGVMTSKGKVIITMKNGASTSAYIKEELVDLLIFELKKRAFSGNPTSNNNSQPPQQENPTNYSAQSEDERYRAAPHETPHRTHNHNAEAPENSEHPSAQTTAPPISPPDARYADLNEYVQNLGLNEAIAASLLSDALLRDLLGSMHDVHEADARLNDIESILHQLEADLARSGNTGAGHELARKIRQLKAAKHDAQIIAFIKNQVETSINLAILHQINLNPELYYLMPGLLNRSEEKLRILASHIAYIQQVVNTQVTQASRTAALTAQMDEPDIPVLLKLNSNLSVHIDNLIQVTADSLPDISANLKSLEAMIKAAANPQQKIDIPENLRAAVNMEQNNNGAANQNESITLDVMKLIQETMRVLPQITAELTQVATVITQNFSQIEPNLIAIRSIPEDLNTPLPPDLKLATINDVTKIGEDKISFNVELKHSIQSAAILINYGVKMCGFEENSFKLNKHSSKQNTFNVTADLKQALSLSDTHKHINEAKHSSSKSREIGL